MRYLARRLTRAASLDHRLPVRIAPETSETGGYDLGFYKDRGGITVSFNSGLVLSNPKYFTTVRQRAAVIAYLLAATRDDIVSCRADISDGNHPAAPDVVSFSSNLDTAVLIPDSDFFRTRGYASAHASAASSPVPWRERSDIILWAGSNTGSGPASKETMSAEDHDLLPRTRLCLLLRDVPGTSARITKVSYEAGPAGSRERMEAAGIFGPLVAPDTWLSQKYAIDIDGNTNAWANLFTRLAFGCCVIKVASPGNYRQWYYGELAAWQHYVPVQADMADLLEKIDWCRSHPKECEAIAAAGQALALEMTFEREMKRGIATLDTALARGH